jgi:uncharacterized protein (DUF58 family)
VIVRTTRLGFALAILLAWVLFLGVLSDRVELFVAAIPLAFGLSGVALPIRPQRIELRQEVSAVRLAEGDRAVVTVTVATAEPAPMVEVVTVLPPSLEVADGNNRAVLAVKPGQKTGWSFTVRCPARGRFDLGTILVRSWDRSGLSVVESGHSARKLISVYPSAERIRHLPRPTRAKFSFGNYVSPRLGEGIEPGEIRPFMAGDRTRHVNWRASLRRQQLYVTQFHEERNADIVLLLDTFSDTGAPPWSTVDVSVRAAAALANAYLERKDRVGFIEFGGHLRWIQPATGRRHGEVLAEGMLPSASHFSYVVPRLDRLPKRVLPPQALVLAVTPLLDDRIVSALVDLGARGYELVVFAVSPSEPTRVALRPSLLNDIACRLWAMEWQARVAELRRGGLTIVEWHPDMLLEAVLAPVSRSRLRWAER